MLQKKLHPRQREDLILVSLRKTGFASVSEIAEQCGVTEMTARRDLDNLAAKNLLVRIHGGAIHPDTASQVDIVEPSVIERSTTNLAGKRAIAKQALKYVVSGETIALDIGSTNQVFASLLTDAQVRVFTCSLPIANQFSQFKSDVYLPGGRVAGLEPSVSGSITIQQLNEHWIDTFFLGCSGIAAEGFFDYSPEDTQVKKALIKRSKRKIALADISKFGRRSVAHISALSEFDVIICDASPSDEIRVALTANNVTLDIAPAL